MVKIQRISQQYTRRKIQTKQQDPIMNSGVSEELKMCCDQVKFYNSIHCNNSL